MFIKKKKQTVAQDARCLACETITSLTFFYLSESRPLTPKLLIKTRTIMVQGLVGVDCS